jgi:hypothetical protein
VAPLHAVKVDLSNPVKLALMSRPVNDQGNKFSIISAGEVRFSMEDMRIDRMEIVHKSPPPGVYGVRWGYMYKMKDIEPELKLEIRQGPFLRATLSAAVVQYSGVDYQISGAVFDASGKLLGVASAVEKVQYIRLGYMPTIFRKIELEFGASQAYRHAAFAVFSVSDPAVPKPPDASYISEGPIGG